MDGKETVAFGYRARALVFEQRVRRPLAIRDMRRFVNGGQRPRHTNLRREFSFPVPLTGVQNFYAYSDVPKAMPMWSCFDSCFPLSSIGMQVSQLTHVVALPLKR